MIVMISKDYSESLNYNFSRNILELATLKDAVEITLLY